MSGVPGKVSTGAGISLGADGYSTSSGTFSAGTTPPITGALNIDASGYGGTFLAATNTSGSSITMSLDATTNTMTVNGNVVVTGTVSEAAVSEGPLTITGGTVTVSTPFLQATQSWNAAGVTFTGMQVNVTDTASASGSLLQDFQVGGVSKFSITKAGAVTAASNLSVATGAVYQINGTSVLSATTLGSGVTGSSLTSVGTLTAGAIGSGFTAIPNSALLNPGFQINGTVIVLGGSGTVTAAAGTLTGTTLNATVVSSSLTSVGTLSAGAVPASLVTAGTFGAGAYTFPSTLAVTGATTIGTAQSTGSYTSKFQVNGSGGNVFVRDNGQELYVGYGSVAGYIGTSYTGSTLYLTSGGGSVSATITPTSFAIPGTLAVTGALSTSERLAITYPSAGVVLQGYVADTLRIAVNGSDSNSGSRGSLLALNGDFSGTLAVTGDVTGGSHASFGVSATIESTIALKGKSSTATSGSYAFFCRDSADAGLFNVRGDGLVSVPGTLAVTGAATFSSDVTVTGYINGAQATTKGPYVGASSAVALTNGSTVLLTSATAGAAIITVYESGSGNGGVFFVNYSGTVVKLAGDGDVTDTGSTFAVYKSAGSHTCTLKNRYGISRSFAIGVYSAAALV